MDTKMRAGLLLLLNSALWVSALQTQTKTQTSTPVSSSARTETAQSTRTNTNPNVAATGISTTAITPTLDERGFPTWAENILNAVGAAMNGVRNQTGSANSSSIAIGNFMSRLPRILQGLGGVDLGGNDVGKTLASLFGDPR